MWRESRREPIVHDFQRFWFNAPFKWQHLKVIESYKHQTLKTGLVIFFLFASSLSPYTSDGAMRTDELVPNFSFDSAKAFTSIREDNEKPAKIDQ